MSRFHVDCRYFRNDRPCVFHKQSGVLCSECSNFSQVAERILIVKLGARGDVLRTTSLLTPIKRKYPNSEIVWLVEPVSAPLLKNIPVIDQIWEADVESLARLHTERFDIAISMDLSPGSCAYLALAKANTKLGFSLSDKGRVFPLDPRGREIWSMSLRDDQKRENKKTYQQLMLDLIGLQGPPGKIEINLTDAELKFANDFAEGIGLGDKKPLLGINVGAGGRWENKSWKSDHLVKLTKMLHEKYHAPILLLGGKDELERIHWLQQNSPATLVSSGTNNSLRQFMAIVNLCDLVITGDTMALHIALGLGKKAVALFGPTSEAEIEMYDQGVKLTADMDCLCCYHERCDKKPDCMEAITPKRVFEAVEALL